MYRNAHRQHPFTEYQKRPSIKRVCTRIFLHLLHTLNSAKAFRAELLKTTRWFKYDRDYLCVNKSQFVPVIFEPPCIKYYAYCTTISLPSNTATHNSATQSAVSLVNVVIISNNQSHSKTPSPFVSKSNQTEFSCECFWNNIHLQYHRYQRSPLPSENRQKGAYNTAAVLVRFYTMHWA